MQVHMHVYLSSLEQLGAPNDPHLVAQCYRDHGRCRTPWAIATVLDQASTATASTQHVTQHVAQHKAKHMLTQCEAWELTNWYSATAAGCTVVWRCGAACCDGARHRCGGDGEPLCSDELRIHAAISPHTRPH